MPFAANVKEIEERVRTSISCGAVTPYYELDLTTVYDVLNSALASEIVCVLRYKQHYYGTTGIHQAQMQGVFKEHWQDEERHLLLIADRIKQLGGVPNFMPTGVLDRGYSRFESGRTLAELLREDLVAERVVVKIYSDIVTFFGQVDPVSRRMFEAILADEQDHADELADLLFTIDPTTGKLVEQLTMDSTIIPAGES